ncbi:signal peptidase [Hydrogenibacillus schlegelii]|uniref:Lipoprotein signal peptidase n=1 Tax=Hydrogenibacillus schlegelii TaxID=1484 RepID=A0A132MGZ7_HYDSH|nr:signal peptidase [Hydrogenibacillus schlegelii]OAR03867.1 signal peptidase II [Hydrogenibacillus schlegelii]
MERRSLTGWPYYGLALFVFILDRATKAWVVRTLSLGETIPLWPGVFHITAHENAGAAFGLLQGARPLFLFLTVGVVAGLLWMLPQAARRSPFEASAYGLILGGALGNFVDRAVTGRVVDFLDVRMIHYPIFNVADSAITVGAGLLAWHFLVRRREAG